ncbi:MAG: hypothetical protein ACRCUT_10150, partial [Spirochaetota bacterium]
KENDTVVRKKTALDEQGYQSLRQKVCGSLSLAERSRPADQEGRYTLLTATTLFSLGMYGPLLASAADIDQEKNIIACEWILGGSGFFFPLWLTHKRQVTAVSASSYIYGSLGGAFHGLTLGMMICGDDMNADRVYPSLIMGLSLAEGIGGFFLAEKYAPSLGQTDSMAWFSAWGSLWAAEAVYISTEMENSRFTGGALFAGSLGGICLGYAMAEAQNYTRGDVIVQNDTMALCAYIPLAAADLAGSDNPKVFMGSSLAGSLAGAAAGYFLVRGKDFTAVQGNFITLGECTGALLGLGIASYFSYDNSALFLSLSSAGGLAGFSVMYYLFKDSAVTADLGQSWSIRIMPCAAAGLLQRRIAPRPRSSYGAASYSTPLVSIEYTFD